MLVKLNALQCDHPEHRTSASARMAGHGARADLVSLRRTAAQRGWASYTTTTRHVYDLCPDHPGQLPGVDFPNWKAAGG